MMSKALLKALNEQINKELYSSYLYLSMAAHFDAANLPGFSHWMTLQSQEEYAHAMKIYKFIQERDQRVTLEAIAKPPAEFKSPLEVIKQALDHERKVSAAINKLYELAVKEQDYPTQIMLHWFIEEQVEEEKTATDIIEQLKLVGDAPAGLMMLDRQLAARSAA